MSDHRKILHAVFRGGPPWTTKLRILVAATTAFPLTLLVGAVWGIVQFGFEFASEAKQAWATSDAEAVRRLGERMRS